VKTLLCAGCYRAAGAVNRAGPCGGPLRRYPLAVVTVSAFRQGMRIGMRGFLLLDTCNASDDACCAESSDGYVGWMMRLLSALAALALVSGCSLAVDDVAEDAARDIAGYGCGDAWDECSSDDECCGMRCESPASGYPKVCVQRCDMDSVCSAESCCVWWDDRPAVCSPPPEKWAELAQVCG
jgi:hypothetical protein